MHHVLKWSVLTLALAAMPAFAQDYRPPIAVLGSDGHSHPAAADASGNLNVNCLTGCTAAAGATSANQTAVQAAPGADAASALAVQGVTGGKVIPIAGGVASGASDSGNPVKAGGVYNSTPPTYTTGQRTDLQSDSRGNLNVNLMSGGSLISNTSGLSAMPGLTVNFWNYPASSGGIVNSTTAVTIKAAAGASIRNYITGCQISHDALGGATELAIRDGAAGTVLWRMRLQTTASENISVVFSDPLRGTANTLAEAVTLTAVTGGVYVNCQGFAGS